MSVGVRGMAKRAGGGEDSTHVHFCIQGEMPLGNAPMVARGTTYCTVVDFHLLICLKIMCL